MARHSIVINLNPELSVPCVHLRLHYSTRESTRSCSEVVRRWHNFPTKYRVNYKHSHHYQQRRSDKSDGQDKLGFLKCSIWMFSDTAECCCATQTDTKVFQVHVFNSRQFCAQITVCTFSMSNHMCLWRVFIKYKRLNRGSSHHKRVLTGKTVIPLTFTCSAQKDNQRNL